VATDPSVQELADVHLIRRLKSRYVRFVDLKAWPELEALFAAEFQFGGQGSMSGPGTFVEHVRIQLADARTVHMLHEPEILLESPGHAAAVWPFSDVIDHRRGRVGLLRRGYGHYHERYIKAPDWRIASMRITRQRIECDDYPEGGEPRSEVFVSQDDLASWLAQRNSS